MKILFIKFYNYPETSSSPHYITDLEKNLIDEGHEVSIICPNPTRGLSKSEIEEQLKYRSFFDSNGAIVKRVFCGKKPPTNFISLAKRIIAFQKKVVSYIKKNNSYDYVFVPSNPPLFFPRKIIRICKKFNIKTIYNINDIYPNILGPLFGIFSPVARYSLKNCDKIVTLSTDMKESLIKLGADSEKIHIIKIWPNDDIKHLDDGFRFNSNSLAVAYIGNIGNFQGIKKVLKLSELFKNDNRIKFYFVGDGKKTKKVLRATKKNKNVIYHNRVSQYQAKLLYRTADVNVISLNKGAIKYAFPSKTIECISTDSWILLLLDESKYSKSIIKSGKAICCAEPQIAATQLQNLINNPRAKQANVLREKLVKEFDKQSNLAKWLSLFE